MRGTCVHNVYGPLQSVIDELPEETQKLVKKNLDLKPVNVRVLEGVELGCLKFDRSNEGTDGYELDVPGLT